MSAQLQATSLCPPLCPHLLAPHPLILPSPFLLSAPPHSSLSLSSHLLLTSPAHYLTLFSPAHAAFTSPLSAHPLTLSSLCLTVSSLCSIRSGAFDGDNSPIIALSSSHPHSVSPFLSLPSLCSIRSGGSDDGDDGPMDRRTATLGNRPSSGSAATRQTRPRNLRVSYMGESEGDDTLGEPLQ